MKKNNWLLNIAAFIIVLAAAIACFLYFQERDETDEAEKFGENVNGKCMERLAMIGIAMNEYMVRNNGKFPKNLEQLFSTGILTDSEYVGCPSNHYHYIYIGNDFSGKVSAETPIVFDCFHNHYGNINVLYADFQVVSLKVRKQAKYSSLFRHNKLTDSEQKILEKRLRLLDKTLGGRK